MRCRDFSLRQKTTILWYAGVLTLQQYYHILSDTQYKRSNCKEQHVSYITTDHQLNTLEDVLYITANHSLKHQCLQTPVFSCGYRTSNRVLSMAKHLVVSHFFALWTTMSHWDGQQVEMGIARAPKITSTINNVQNTAEPDAAPIPFIVSAPERQTL